MQRLTENLSVSLIANDVITPVPRAITWYVAFSYSIRGLRGIGKGHFEDVFFVSDSIPRGLLKTYGMKNCESFFCLTRRDEER